MKPQEWTQTVEKAGDAIVSIIMRNRKDTGKTAPFGKDVVRTR